MAIPHKCKCKNCHKLFRPDPRNADRQKYCFTPECRKASKAASQRQWLAKPENRDYFKGPHNVQRVQEWRSRNPGYWKKGSADPSALQDLSTQKETKNQQDAATLPNRALQDLLSSQHIVFLGLLSLLTGSALQDDIVMTARRMRQLGQDILNNRCNKGGAYDDQQNPHLPPSNSQDSRTVQLD